jgi:hypothetical protein
VGAGKTFPTGNLGFNGHPLSLGEPGYVLAGFLDNAGYFVTLDHRITCIGVYPVIDMDIAAAYANPLNFDQYFVRFNSRYWNIIELDYLWGGHYCLFHDLITLESMFHWADHFRR